MMKDRAANHALRAHAENMNRKIMLLLGSLLAVSAAWAAEPSAPTHDAEYERAYAQEREADVVVFYDTGKELDLQRPERKQPFGSEAALLAFLAERKEPKRLLVVVLSKRHDFSDPKQTLEGFWQACKKTGFQRVVIQQGRAFGRPILRE